MRKIRKHLSFANVVACMALFVALGGVSYAATQLPKNSVGTEQLQANAVKTNKLDRNAVRTGKIAFEAVRAGKLSKNAVPTNRLRDGAVTGEKVGDGSLNTSDLAPGTIPPPVNAYTKPESDGRYLRGTITVVGTIPPVAADSFQSSFVNCPSGFQAVGGGVDPSNIFYGKVSSSGPTFGGQRAYFQPAGQLGPATGWFGAVSTEGAGTGAVGASKVVVICSPIG